MKHTTHSNKAGFTLIELSIVLVIIGLIVGGVLVGQDLIKAAEIRSTVAQLEKYSTAVNTFRNKYNALPGDISSPGNFGLLSTGADGSTGKADGNGLIAAVDGDTDADVGFSGEARIFWYHLSQANLIGDGISALTYAAGAVATIGDTHMPLTKIAKGNRVHIASVSGVNYFAIANFSAAAADGGLSATEGLTPMESFQIDTKMDDGKASTGVIISITDNSGTLDALTIDGGSSSPDGDGTDDCYDTDTGSYATDATNANILACELRVRASF